MFRRAVKMLITKDTPISYLTVGQLQQVMYECVSNYSLNSQTSNIPEILDSTGAAELLHKTPNAIRVMVCNNQIPYFKKNHKLFFKRSELLEYVESGRVEVQKAIEPVDALVVNKKKGAKPC
jgi:archaeosine-15-forming tRNA-guanine transglycosylase